MALAATDASAALTAEWEALAESLDAVPFLRPEWFAAWSRAFGKGPVQPVVVRDGGELSAVMPMEACRRGLRTPSNWHSPFYAPLAISPDACEQVLQELFRRSAPTIELDLLAGGKTAQAIVADAARRQGRVVASRTVACAPFIELDGDLVSYERSLSRNRRRSLRRQRRRLEERGAVSFEVHHGETGLDALLEELLAVEASGWKGTRGTAIASRTQTRRFYTDIARWAADRGWLRLSFLRLDGEPIAADYALEHGGVWYSLKAGYDERLRRYGPGALLLREEIAHCYEAGLARLDLLGSEDPFKLSWTSRGSARIWVGAFRRNPTGLSRWAGATAGVHARRWHPRRTTSYVSETAD